MSGETAMNSVESKRPVNLSGTAEAAKEAPPLGLVDVGESPRAYLFQFPYPVSVNLNHHCRRCGGLFCGSCTSQRMYLRGQGESPVRICEPCKTLEEAARFELRYGHKNKSRKGNHGIITDLQVESEIFCLHGGLSPSIETLDNIRNLLLEHMSWLWRN